MARMHSRDKGKAGSKKPLKQKPTWVSFKQKEMEMLVVKLAKQGMASSQIGLHLRDAYGVPSVKAITGKKVNSILKEKKIAKKLPEDFISLIEKAIAIRKHISTSKRDQTAKRGLTLTESKIKRLMKYYKRTGVLDADWYYDAKRAELLLE
ncbi:MAG: 30S ribosomal protein S15 [Nanoarchaeota archaeon]|nr:30S ribosomal protein S15 [Nanoarchaeota archaeon]